MTRKPDGGRPLPYVLLTSLLAGCGASATNPSVSTIGSSAATAAGSTVPIVAGCQIFPTNNPWNTDISKYPIDANSANYIKSIPGNLHPDFGNTAGYGIPFNIVPASQALVPVAFGYASQSDPGPYPVPKNAYIEGWPHPSGDRHVLILQKGTCTLYELFAARELDGGKKWTAQSGAIFHLNSNALRPNGWTSADAAGLPIMPALVKCDEVAAGVIDHALRFTVPESQRGFIHPATHFASSSIDPNLPPMGMRVRLKASYSLAGFNTVSRIILTAMKKYGMFVADGGSGSWYFQGQGGPQESCWSNNQLNQLKSVPGTAFEVVKTGPILRIDGP
jgi:hypothetical protein